MIALRVAVDARACGGSGIKEENVTSLGGCLNHQTQHALEERV